MHCFSIKKTFVQAIYYNFFNDFRIVYVINKVADDKLRASRLTVTQLPVCWLAKSWISWNFNRAIFSLDCQITRNQVKKRDILTNCACWNIHPWFFAARLPDFRGFSFALTKVCLLHDLVLRFLVVSKLRNMNMYMCILFSTLNRLAMQQTFISNLFSCFLLPSRTFGSKCVQ